MNYSELRAKYPKWDGTVKVRYQGGKQTFHAYILSAAPSLYVNWSAGNCQKVSAEQIEEYIIGKEPMIVHRGRLKTEPL